MCVRCDWSGEVYRASRNRLMCRACQHQSSVTAGTIFEKTRTPLRTWLAAAWYLTNQKQGVSALGLQRVLGLGSYQTAWTMLHRFRRAMIRPGREKLKGAYPMTPPPMSFRSSRRSSKLGHEYTRMARQPICHCLSWVLSINALSWWAPKCQPMYRSPGCIEWLH